MKSHMKNHTCLLTHVRRQGTQKVRNGKLPGIVKHIQIVVVTFTTQGHKVLKREMTLIN